jgi:hypothetical protein
VRDLERAARDFDARLSAGPRADPPGGGPEHPRGAGERGEGFHHVAYTVDSLAAVTAEMGAAGHPVIARIHSFGAAAYYDTAAALGFLVEAVEPPSEMPPVDFVL